jgi:hypothetical protein
MFSAINRQDRWVEDKQNYEVISPADVHDPVARDFVYNSNKKVFFRNYMLYRMALKNLFEAHNIPYIFYLSIEILEFLEKNKMEIDMTNLLPNQYQLFANDIHYAGDANIITRDHPRTKCMHWGPLGHEALANHAYNKINELYPKLEKISGMEYLTDLNFIKLAEPSYRNFYCK